MARDKKAKKGCEEETGEEVARKNASKESTPDTIASGKSAKKGKKGRKVDANEDVVEDFAALTLEEKAVHTTKKSGKSKGVENDDLDDTESKLKNAADHEESIKTAKKEKRSKKGKSLVDNEAASSTNLQKKKTAKIDPNISSDEDDSATFTPKKSDKPAGFSLLAMEEDVDDFNDNDVEDEFPQKKAESLSVANGMEGDQKTESKGNKKSKKKERKRRKDEDDEDIDKLLEELALEMTGQKKPTEPSAESANIEADTVNIEKSEPDLKQSKKEKKKKKASENEAKDDKLENEEPAELIDSEQHIIKTAAEKSEPDLKQSKKEKKKKKTPENEAKEDKLGSEEPADLADSEIHTVKTAAEKKKEKKEKEKQKKKKAAEFEQSQSTKKSAAEESKKSLKPSEEIQPVITDTNVPDDDDEEKKDDDDEVDDKKKKKKKDDDKKDKKRPGKKQIAAMQEALKKVREEEERLRLEEEAKIKAAEEAERLRLEKLRLEQERKERKKQKEKEKRERLKAEGKLLTKTQRQNKARMEATLAALRQQGVEVPLIGEKRERAPRLGDRKRLSKKRNENVQEDDKDESVLSEVSNMETKDLSPETEVNVEDAENAEEIPGEVENEDELGDVKDAWDESSDEEESDPSSKVEIVVKEKGTKGDSDDSVSDESESSDDESGSEETSSESESEGRKNEEKLRERVLERIKKRREEAEMKRDPSKLRSPVVCVLGHVDTGKTKILDKIRRTNVQDGEAGGITQQIGATMVPKEALNDQCKMVKNFAEIELKLPGLLIIDTPGHESFSNLRSRGSSLCDIAVLVVDIMHGLEPQTIESVNLLKQKKTPFIVALNKIDRLYEWKSLKNRDVEDVIKNQARNTKMEFDDRAKDVILQFANQGLNAVLCYENTDPRSYVSMVPTSALTGDGMGNLMALIVQLTQNMMTKRLTFSEELQATILEVKAIPGLGTTVDAILVNGRLREGDTIVFAGYEGAVVTQIRSLLMPQPLKELRVKGIYQEFKEIEGAQGVKITGKDLDKAIAGLQLMVAHQPDEVPILKEEVASSFKEAMSSIKLSERGVYVQASTLGSLEALLEFLRASKIPYAGIRIGPVVKKDVMKASVMLEHDSQYAVILAFDVKIERDAQELADSLGVKIFEADIIYHLFDKFMAYREELKNKKRDEFKSVAVFPCKLRILPQYVFNSRDPIVVGVIVEAGIVKEGTPLCVPSKDFLDIGTVTTIEINHKAIESARKGQEVCIKIDPVGGEAPKMFGRHFDHTDLLVSKITRQSIDVCKEHFRDDLQKTDWQLMVELKKIFQIL